MDFTHQSAYYLIKCSALSFQMLSYFLFIILADALGVLYLYPSENMVFAL